MDIFYFGDCAPYGSMRSSSYRDFEKFPIGSLEQTPQVRSAYCVAQAKLNSHCHKDKRVKKDNCPFCKEKKKKPLASYIRRREQNKRTESICEEEEEEEDEDEAEDHENERRENERHHEDQENKTTSHRNHNNQHHVAGSACSNEGNIDIRTGSDRPHENKSMNR